MSPDTHIRRICNRCNRHLARAGETYCFNCGSPEFRIEEQRDYAEYPDYWLAHLGSRAGCELFIANLPPCARSDYRLTPYSDQWAVVVDRY